MALNTLVNSVDRNIVFNDLLFYIINKIDIFDNKNLLQRNWESMLKLKKRKLQGSKASPKAEVEDIVNLLKLAKEKGVFDKLHLYSAGSLNFPDFSGKETIDGQNLFEKFMVAVKPNDQIMHNDKNSTSTKIDSLANSIENLSAKFENIKIPMASHDTSHVAQHQMSSLHQRQFQQQPQHESEFNADVIAITETWLNDSSAHSEQIKNYNFLFKNRLARQGGGVGFFVRDDLIYITRDDLTLIMDDIEIMAIEIIRKSKNIIVFVMYRPPNMDASNSIELIHDFINKTKRTNRKITYITGDFNIDLLKNDCRNIQLDFSNMLSYNNLVPLVTNPTRITDHSATLLDNIFTNDFNSHFSGIFVSDISDHLPIFSFSNFENEVDNVGGFD
ncbi:hypothetical protein HELRODRAFT_162160 [Helobdella robusta]|uniref:Endonuclease/exonuclease/phosphatase domain-containing protein n=1 Tax=Helobdella robusta TaxID=6412 RepID=T1ESA6_HELRO|nr:hypothetical protein HELRODRAFT_162160 [Helobdella robusta]ESN98707.1 hypothetical protein HELRODRAFT_162160 [Helobdella robusta]